MPVRGRAGGALLLALCVSQTTAWGTPLRVRALTVLTLAAGLASTIFAPVASTLAGALGWRAGFLVLAGSIRGSRSRVAGNRRRTAGSPDRRGDTSRRRARNADPHPSRGGRRTLGNSQGLACSTVFSLHPSPPPTVLAPTAGLGWRSSLGPIPWRCWSPRPDAHSARSPLPPVVHPQQPAAQTISTSDRSGARAQVQCAPGAAATTAPDVGRNRVLTALSRAPGMPRAGGPAYGPRTRAYWATSVKRRVAVLVHRIAWSCISGGRQAPGRTHDF
jgi:hypothetical protein